MKRPRGQGVQLITAPRVFAVGATLFLVMGFLFFFKSTG